MRGRDLEPARVDEEAQRGTSGVVRNIRSLRHELDATENILIGLLDRIEV